MNLDKVRFHLEAYRTHGQVLDAAQYIIRNFGLEHENFAGFGFREELSEKSLLLTAEGALGGKQKVYIPRNLFDFNLPLVLNLLAHEMLHVRQKAPDALVEDKNEREWQAYTEMLFHTVFPNIPDAPDFNRKQFAQKALEYYKRMGENSLLQLKYAAEKVTVQALLVKLSEKKESHSAKILNLKTGNYDTDHSN